MRFFSALIRYITFGLAITGIYLMAQVIQTIARKISAFW